MTAKMTATTTAKMTATKLRFSLTGSLLASLLSLPSPLQAAPKKYTKQEVEVQGVPQTQLTKPPPPPKNQKSSGPVLTIEEFVQSRQDKIQEINDKLITQVQRMLRITGDDD